VQPRAWAIKVSLLGPAAHAELVETPPAVRPDWLSPGGKPRYRLDAVAKFTGAKTFSRDYRTRDLSGWPSERSHEFLIRATKADRTFEGVDLSTISDGLNPDRLIMHEDLAADGVRVPDPDF
jgi:CO/xanthine dehydrogenase Mo-binding subunit